jgi:hypothetical protein
METVAILEKVFAGVMVLACVALLARQFIGERRRLRLDATLRRATRSVTGVFLRLYRWPAARRAAHREAEAAIRRARGEPVARDGNVYRPKSFRKPRKLH